MLLVFILFITYITRYDLGHSEKNMSEYSETLFQQIFIHATFFYWLHPILSVLDFK